jgi:hypothetical protein
VRGLDRTPRTRDLELSRLSEIARKPLLMRPSQAVFRKEELKGEIKSKIIQVRCLLLLLRLVTIMMLW